MDMVALREVRVEKPAKAAKQPGKSKSKKAAVGQPDLFDRQADEHVAADGRPVTTADAPFAGPIAECAELVCEGRFYAGLALAQAVVEAVVLLVWRVKVRKRKNQLATFSKALVDLHSNSLIEETSKSTIDRLWSDRDAVLVSRPSEDSISQLEATARSSLALLEEIADEFFGYSEQEGVIIPTQPEYWSAYEAETPVLAGS